MKSIKGKEEALKNMGLMPEEIAYVTLPVHKARLWRKILPFSDELKKLRKISGVSRKRVYEKACLFF